LPYYRRGRQRRVAASAGRWHCATVGEMLAGAIPRASLRYNLSRLPGVEWQPLTARFRGAASETIRGSMIYFIALIPATALTVAGYFVLFLSHRSEGAFRRSENTWAFGPSRWPDWSFSERYSLRRTAAGRRHDGGGEWKSRSGSLAGWPKVLWTSHGRPPDNDRPGDTQRVPAPETPQTTPKPTRAEDVASGR